MLSNIVENALKYTPEGGQVSIEVRRSDTSIEVDSEIPVVVFPLNPSRTFSIGSTGSRVTVKTPVRGWVCPLHER